MPPPLQPHIFDLTPDDLRDLVTDAGMPAFRATQILDWVYRKGVTDPAAMTNLAARDRDTLASTLTFLRGDILEHQHATDGTQKLLVDWGMNTQPTHADAKPPPVDEAPGFSLPQAPQPDPKNQTECVMIPTPQRRTACISSQIGCPVGCTFCASGLGGLDGQLSAGQIVQQVWQLSRTLADQQDALGRITNVVFMGMGEPLANLPNVTRALQTLTADWGMNLSARKITVSTVGVVPGIKKLAQLNLPITLAISLHAPNDALRREIIPWAKFTTVAELIDAGQFYFENTGREVTLEYILLGKINDQPPHAEQLATVAKKLRGNVNLIRYNPVAELPYERPTTDDVHRFQEVLRQQGINSHIRASRGQDIAAACGQLRHESAAT